MKRIIKLIVPIILALTVVLSSIPVSAMSFQAIRKNPNYRYGVDVSQWNGEEGNVDWAYLRKVGVEFAFIRIGTYHTFGGVVDSKFKQNVKGAVENGIEFGVYVYSYVYKKSDNKKCGEWVVNTLKSLGNYTKDADTIQVAYDIEDEVQANAVYYGKISKTYLTDSVRTFSKTVKNSGYIPTVYASSSFFSDYLIPDSLRKDNIKLWCAQWPYYPDTTMVKTLYDGVACDLWQFSGDAAGCDNVRIKSCIYDCNVCYNEFYDYANEDSKLRIEGLKDTYKYNAGGVKPSFSVYDGDNLLKKGKDYKLFYFRNKSVGTGMVKIIRYKNSKYIETKTALFEIIPPIKGVKTSSTYDEINIQWNKIPNVSYYQIYEYDPTDGTYSQIDTVKSNSYCDYELEEGTNYKLKIRAVYKKGDKELFGEFKKISASTKYKKVTGVSAEYLGDGQVKLNWKSKTDNCEGYEVECASNPYFSNSVTRTVNGISKCTKVCRNLKSGKTYYFKVRSFNTGGSGKTYSVDSKKVYATVK